MLHGGEVYHGHKITYDFSVNVNPLGIPENVLEAIRDCLPRLAQYPDGECRALRRALAASTGLAAPQILCGNGASELMEAAVRALRPRRILLPAPSFSGYRHAAEGTGAAILYHWLRREEGFSLTDRFLDDLKAQRPDMAILCSPANPVGNLIDPGLLDCIIRTCEGQGTWLMVDECFLGLLHDEGQRTARRYLMGRAYPARHLLVLDAFTKRFALPGIRLGFLMAADADILGRIHAQQPEWSVSIPAQAAGVAALATEKSCLAKARSLIRTERARMEAALRARGFRVYPGQANFIFFSDLAEMETASRAEITARTPANATGQTAKAATAPPAAPSTQAPPVSKYVDGEKNVDRKKETLFDLLLEKGFLIRDCSNYPGLQRGDYRVAVLKPKENDALLQAIAEYKEQNDGRAAAPGRGSI